MSARLPFNATLVERFDLDPTLAIFRIRPDSAPPPDERWFVPGQYVAVGSEDVQRAYSIASEPAERRWLEFYVRYARDPATDSPLTHLLWKMPVGTRLHLGAKMAGRFTLARTRAAGDARVALCVAAGTGLAPFVSMIRDARRRGDEALLRRAVVLHGVSHPHELAYREELLEASERFGLGYVPTVSRATQHPDWRGTSGRVETLLDDDRLAGLLRGPEAGGLSPERTVVYVCGFRGTIAASLERLLARGFLPDDRRVRRLIGLPADGAASLYYEQYDLEPVFEPDDAALVALRARIGRAEDPGA